MVSEEYISILEDDNWWEPDFLASMLAVMDEDATVSVSWANMWLSRELEDGSWRQEGTIWPEVSGTQLMKFSGPDARQACGALHSNGAMLVRVCKSTMFPVPNSLPFFAIEPMRERCYPYPMVLHTRPLASFALTQVTARNESADVNLQILVLLVANFLSGREFTRTFYREIWIACRGARGHKHRALIAGAAVVGRAWAILKAAPIWDLIVAGIWVLRHPLRFRKMLRSRISNPEVAEFLDQHAVSTRI
jgi:hypothetical protein